MKVAVLGGGAAGLGAALTLLEGGADVLLFEAGARPGGKVGTFVEGGFTTENGPTALAPAAEKAFELSQRLGLGGEIREAGGSKARFVWKGGRLRKAPSFGLLSPFGWTRAALEPLLARAEGPEDRPLQAYLVDHLGEEAGRLGAEVMAKGVYAGDPTQLSLREAFPSLGGIAAKHRSLFLGGIATRRAARAAGKPLAKMKGLWSFQRGLGAFTDALAARLGDRLRLGAPVESLAPREPGWTVTWGGATPGSAQFDAVVLALPAFAAAKLCAGLSPRLAAALEAFPYAPIAVVHLGVPDSSLRQPADGFGLLDGQSGPTGGLTLLGCLFPASLFPGRAPAGHSLLTSMVGGARRPELLDRSDGELVELVRADVGRALGLSGPPAYTRVVRHPRGIPQVTVGHSGRLREAEAAAALLPGLSLCGAAYHGVSVDSAVRSGVAAARRLLE
jgi:oxygen-dependent protoporphyrinogen oxidase